jgi:hypothetical protein
VTDYTELKRLAETVNEVCEGVKDPQMVVTTATVLALIAENERMRFALKRIVKSTDGVFPKDHRIDVHVSTIALARRTLWPNSREDLK